MSTLLVCPRFRLRAVLSLLGALLLTACQRPIEPAQAEFEAADGTESAPPEPALRAAYLQSVQKAAGPEYAFSSGAARNPSQRLDVWFDRQGIRLRSTDLPSQPQVAMSLQSYGCAEAPRMAELTPPISTETANRLEYRRDGVTEWYVNGPLGLEQGFTVEKDLGCGEAGALAFTLELGGDLVPALVGQGAAARIELREQESGRSLRYGDLFAYDADGKSLASRLVLAEGRVRLEVEASEARYPVTVDPLWTEQARLSASDGAASDYFGWAVSVSGDTAVVGAPHDSWGSIAYPGRAYVYVRSGTSWTEQAKLTASDGAATDFFGLAVSVSGDTVVVGAPYMWRIGRPQQGQAYVYVRSGTSWTEQAKLTASDGATGDYFGLAVSVNRDTVLIGAYNKTVSGRARQGQVYVYVRTEGTFWTEQARLTASDGAAADFFGAAVSMSENTALVGAYNKSVGGRKHQGQAYVYVRSGTFWTEQAKLTASNGAASDKFGLAVSVSGDTAVVGAPNEYGGASQPGRAYVYARTGTFWTEQARLGPSGGAVGGSFGWAVSVSGDTAIIGAKDANYATVLKRAGTLWTPQAKLTASDGAASDKFGLAVSVSGDTAVVGAPYKLVAGRVAQGQAYIFNGK